MSIKNWTIVPPVIILIMSAFSGIIYDFSLLVLVPFILSYKIICESEIARKITIVYFILYSLLLIYFFFPASQISHKSIPFFNMSDLNRILVFIFFETSIFFGIFCLRKSFNRKFSLRKNILVHQIDVDTIKKPLLTLKLLKEISSRDLVLIALFKRTLLMTFFKRFFKVRILDGREMLVLPNELASVKIIEKTNWDLRNVYFLICHPDPEVYSTFKKSKALIDFEYLLDSCLLAVIEPLEGNLIFYSSEKHLAETKEIALAIDNG